MSIADLRNEYEQNALHKRDLDADPLVQFQRWLEDAVNAEMVEPTAMTLATATPDGAPSARVVLLKGVDAEGFTFFTNYQSQKGHELAANPRACLCWWWDKLQRQVRAVGPVTRVSREESAQYWKSRPRPSQLGALASSQSEVVANRAVLEQRFAELADQHEGADVPLPEHWGGYRLTPLEVEFWSGRRSRLHDRLRYRRSDEGDAWVLERLSP